MDKYVSADTIWVLIGAFLVFSMQPGFAMVETGFTRAKNAANIVMKNVMDMSLGSIVFWILGFGLMFGEDIGGFIGAPDFFVKGDYGAAYPSSSFFIFQTMFCATAATIVSGAMAERTNFLVYCIYSVLISALVYPISGHWIWGGGWLAEMGFHDFAGSTAVHMVGGVAALIGAKMIGPRIGKYNEDGSVNAIPGHSIPLGALGVFLLWFGWFGFNGASTVCATGDEALISMGDIFITTNMAAAAGSTATMIYTWVRYGKPDVSMTLNGVLAGLVAITAGCDVVSPAGALIIGLLAGVLVVVAVEFFDQKLKIDDPVGAISVHGVCGAFGTIVTGLFATKDGLFYGAGSSFLMTQIIGVVTVAIYVAVAMTIIFRVLDKLIGLRVSEAEEIKGLDMEEHGLLSSYADFMPTVEEMPSVTTTYVAPAAVTAPSVAASAGEHKLSKVCIITSQNRFEALKTALDKLGITGMTVTKVLGYGIQKGQTEMYRGAEVAAHLLPKVKVEMIVSAIPVADVVNTAKAVLYTGKYGDGKIFVYNVEDVVKIRTGETGFDALQDKPIEG
ncbi:ammonium transporter [Phascolarctobacterium sp.]|uniref:ammonium transporter n=1 Tax=Phascolarctobacterium sp. TaxID=2049039 RepID=UPI002A7F0EFA|nr:ammonium transporter [Phascolarctobacterium sp.]MDY5044901.1 ammonium transporter [Phascolarctobacterium sp.]